MFYAEFNLIFSNIFRVVLISSVKCKTTVKAKGQLKSFVWDSDNNFCLTADRQIIFVLLLTGSIVLRGNDGDNGNYLYLIHELIPEKILSVWHGYWSYK